MILTLFFLQIGFDGFEKYNQDKLGLKSEKYMMHEITRSLTQPINDHVVKARRMVEYQLFQTQFRFTASHIVDKQWYTSWLDFISGKQDHDYCLTCLLNDKMNRQIK